MKKVRYFSKESDVHFATLTNGKIYDVINNIPCRPYHIITIYDDYNVEQTHYFNWLFTDATTQYRNDIIDGILS